MNIIMIRCVSQTAHTFSKSSWKRSKRQRKFVDWIRIKVLGGNGGDGCMSFRREAFLPRGGPDGGDGGRGGNIVFIAGESIHTLGLLRNRYTGENGGHGKGKKRHGPNGKDSFVKVPIGTVIKEEGDIIADLSSEGAQFIAAQGGDGGIGNVSFVSPQFQSPRIITDGKSGEEKILEAELKTIADVGMVGFPNAGKSTLLRAISRARPAIAAYPFTTINPHVGVVEGPDNTKISVADIPGILPGAHDNYGLGHSFLKHIERCHTLLYILDPSQYALPHSGTSTRKPDLFEQLKALQTELWLYNSSLSKRPHVIIVNKMDIKEADICARQLRQKTDSIIIPVSGHYRLNIESFVNVLYKLYKMNKKL